MKTIITLLLCTSLAFAQETKASVPVYDIPFASKDNVIELSITNSSAQATEGVNVDITNLPEWIKFEKRQITIPALKPKEERTASFTFSVAKSAPIDNEQTLNFTITAKNGQSWTKEIRIKIASPATYELLQNYPNPFNPTTAISYQLPVVSKVSLRIFNMLGQEVATVVDGDRRAGYHEEIWDATRCASGVYVYQLIATDEKGQKQAARKRMMLLK